MLISVMKDILAGTLLQEAAAISAAFQACTKHNPCHESSSMNPFGLHGSLAKCQSVSASKRVPAVRAFSSEVGTGSREENAS
jgi:hypothetical protein